MNVIESDFIALFSMGHGTLQTAIGALILLILLIVITVKLSKPVRWIMTGFEDLFGEPARKGVSARSGILERQQATESVLAEVASTLSSHTKLLQELAPNHGGSIKDKVDQTHTAIEDLTRRLDAVETAVGTQNTTVNVNPGVPDDHERS